MNERIAKLYDRAIVIEDGGNYVCGELDPVKFAELIVRECARISNEVDYTMTNQGAASAQAFMEHFGIEE